MPGETGEATVGERFCEYAKVIYPNGVEITSCCASSCKYSHLGGRRLSGDGGACCFTDGWIHEAQRASNSSEVEVAVA